MNAHQRYTYLGLLIILAMALIVAWLIWAAFYLKDTVREEKPEYAALRMQCDARDGLLATGSGPQGTDVSCYQGQKKIWWVRLR